MNTTNQYDFDTAQRFFIKWVKQMKDIRHDMSCVGIDFNEHTGVIIKLDTWIKLPIEEKKSMSEAKVIMQVMVSAVRAFSASTGTTMEQNTAAGFIQAYGSFMQKEKKSADALSKKETKELFGMIVAESMKHGKRLEKLEAALNITSAE